MKVLDAEVQNNSRGLVVGQDLYFIILKHIRSYFYQQILISFTFAVSVAVSTATLPIQTKINHIRFEENGNA